MGSKLLRTLYICSYFYSFSSSLQYLLIIWKLRSENWVFYFTWSVPCMYLYDATRLVGRVCLHVEVATATWLSIWRSQCVESCLHFNNHYLLPTSTVSSYCEKSKKCVCSVIWVVILWWIKIGTVLSVCCYCKTYFAIIYNR